MQTTFSRRQFENYLSVVRRYASRPAGDTRSFGTFLDDLRWDMMHSSMSTRASFNGKQICDDAQIVAEQMASTCEL